MMTPQEAASYHHDQVKAFALADVDVVTAVTINYINEAIGIINSARKFQMPVVISFTVEKDGRLPAGESLQQAIEATDAATDAYASHYMINCAHPDQFVSVLANGGAWKKRIRGIRANASAKSHAELDCSASLDAGDKCALAARYMQLFELLPNLKVIGGCCGTDVSHLEHICRVINLS